MFDAMIPKSCSSNMFEQIGATSNTPSKSGLRFVRAKNTTLIVTYGALEHCENLFEQVVRVTSLFLEHNTVPLEGTGFVRAGRTTKIGYLYWPQIWGQFTPVNVSGAMSPSGCVPSRGRQSVEPHLHHLHSKISNSSRHAGVAGHLHGATPRPGGVVSPGLGTYRNTTSPNPACRRRGPVPKAERNPSHAFAN